MNTFFLYVLSTIFAPQPAEVYSEKVYVVNTPLKTMIEKVANDSHGDGNVTIPELVKKAPIYVKTEFFPQSRYYRLDIVLTKPYNRAVSAWKCLELWAKDDGVIVRSRVQIELKTNEFPIRWVNAVKRMVLRKIECEILNLEEDAIKALGD